MKFDKYQLAAAKFDLFAAAERADAPGMVEKVLGLVGEAGETADKFKKIVRDKEGRISRDDKEEIAGELGDVLWYVATIARYLEIPLEEVAKGNLRKLESRQQRGKIKGSGDHR